MTFARPGVIDVIAWVDIIYLDSGFFVHQALHALWGFGKRENRCTCYTLQQISLIEV